MKQYICQYKDNETSEFKTYEFSAKNDTMARLIAEQFCDEGWHKLYGILRIK